MRLNIYNEVRIVLLVQDVLLELFFSVVEIFCLCHCLLFVEETYLLVEA